MKEFWTVVEIQIHSDGTVDSHTFDPPDYDNAIGAYYSSLSTGATNGMAYHATYLINSKRGQVKFNIYDRQTETPEEV